MSMDLLYSPKNDDGSDDLFVKVDNLKEVKEKIHVSEKK